MSGFHTEVDVLVLPFALQHCPAVDDGHLREHLLGIGVLNQTLQDTNLKI